MAKIVDSCCMPSSMTVQLTKPDKNNNTTANVDDGMILTAEHSDTADDGTNQKAENTGNSDKRHHSLHGDNNGPQNDNVVATETTAVASSSSLASNDEIDVPINDELTIDNTNTSTNSVSTTDPYKDFSGVDTESFITTTLRNSPKDRILLLTLETVFQQFIQDDEQKTYQFQAMNSYERMIVHRVAAFFGLDHNVDKNGQAVVVTKTHNTRIPNFSFRKYIPEDESVDIMSSTSTTEDLVSLTNPTEVPTRRILRRNDKNPNYEHSQRNSLNDEYTNQQFTSTTKTQALTKPYIERVNNYAETRARIFNETTEVLNSSIVNKNIKTNQKQHSNFIRPSYRKQNQHQNSPQQHRSYTCQPSHTTNTHTQQYLSGKTMDPSSHMLNTSISRTPSLYPNHQSSSSNLGISQPPIHAPIVASGSGPAPMRPPAAASFYAQPQQLPVDYDYKQQSSGAYINNYVPMMSSIASNFVHHHHQQQQQPQPQQLHPPPPPTTPQGGPNQVQSQHGAGIPLPILVHQQPSGQIQYLFPAHPLHQQLQPPPPNAYPLTPDPQYVQLYRPDTLSIPGPPTVPPSSSVVDVNNTHHHPYSQNQPCHRHPISQQQPPQQQQQVPPTQSNSISQPPPFFRIYPTGTQGNVSHPFAPAAYQSPPPAPTSQTTFVQPGAIPAPPFMIPPLQTAASVQTYPTFDNGVSYNTYGPTTTGKPNVNNNGTSMQYATNHLSTLNLQTEHDGYQTRIINNQQTRFLHSNGSIANNQQRNFMGRPLVQSPNGSSTTPRMTIYATSNQQLRQNRPLSVSNTDKQIPSIENDPKPVTVAQQQNNCNNNSLAGPAQE